MSCITDDKKCFNKYIEKKTNTILKTKKNILTWKHLPENAK